MKASSPVSVHLQNDGPVLESILLGKGKAVFHGEGIHAIHPQPCTDTPFQQAWRDVCRLGWQGHPPAPHRQDAAQQCMASSELAAPVSVMHAGGNC